MKGLSQLVLASLALFANVHGDNLDDFAYNSENVPMEVAGDLEALLAEEGIATSFENPPLPSNVELLETFSGRNEDGTYKEDFSGVQSIYGCDGKVENLKGCRYEGQVNPAAYTSSHAPMFAKDTVLRLGMKSRFYGVTLPIPSAPVKVTDSDVDPFIFQYEVGAENGLKGCGGMYLKLLENGAEETNNLNGDTEYSIMFGPDRCGASNKLHFIWKHKNPVTGDVIEHAMTEKVDLPRDNALHLYTLIIDPSNDWSFAIKVDNEVKVEGHLEDKDAFSPALIPAETIDDPNDFKPSDYPQAKIADPEASKPEDWDEDAPETIPDPTAERPEDWDDEDDGEWEPESIANPAYKGKWYAPLIDNPEYEGEWAPQQIANPSYFNKDTNPEAFKDLIKPIGAVGLEVWTVDDGTIFDNILMTRDAAVASEWTKATFMLKQKASEAYRTIQEKHAGRLRLAELSQRTDIQGVLYYNFIRFQTAVQDVLPFQVTEQVFMAVCICLVITVFVVLLFFFIGGFGTEQSEAEADMKRMMAEAAASKKSDDAKVEQEEQDDDDDEIEEEEEEEEKNEGKGSLRKRKGKRKSPKA